MVDYYDISPIVSENTAVFPGDVPFTRKVSLSIDHGDHLGLSSIETTVHLGAHTDAPNHYAAGGDDIASRSLDYYLGPCQVIGTVLEPGDRILPKHIAGAPILAPRVLFRTGSYPDPDHWRSDFNALSPELIEYLADQRVVLVGIDTPSIDPAEDKVLLAHHAVAARDLAILEGVVLDQTPDGLYFLIALPLRIQGADASPVRAILVKGLTI